MQLIDTLSKFLKTKGISVLRFSNESGISAYKVYKWIDKKGNPKHDDAKKIEIWLSKMELVPRETSDITSGGDMDYLTITQTKPGFIATPTDKDKMIQQLVEQVRKLEDEKKRLYELLDKSLQK